MANAEHVAKLKEDVGAWNRWREENPDVIPDLSGAFLSNAPVIEGVDIRPPGDNESFRAPLEKVNFIGARLYEADFSFAHLEKAEFGRAHLRQANFSEAHLEKDILPLHSVYRPEKIEQGNDG